ncbi:aminotransferase, class I/II [Leptospira inadai serovar Lyme str. 10]|uniref:alanine transaminase n=2 Tax=Leptospira inadai serovar Lyme TaxID=293084 RepID=V6H8J8_9LEPT|nr:pyridoxal phosphate-dependent aminotransferase [Leptospira inadai]EQA35261.1 aminotransferase, class I/II [Leptospira inadai serovar Lyme str. 10]PNV75997.1 pyridoxal phosphate-dependent aminotransferase [Leptospira inadai serovar Lyme]
MRPDFRSKFSGRFEFESGENDLYLKVKELRDSGIEIVDLTVSNPTQVKITYPNEVILHSLSRLESLTYEPAPKGILSAREAVSKYYQERNIQVSPDDFFLTSSSSEAYSYILKLLCDPGDEVLIPAPGYPLFEFLTLLEGIKFRTYTLNSEANWEIDFESLERNLSSKTKLIFLVSPNNPTGSFLNDSEFSRLVDLSESRGIGLVLDEVFVDYLHDEGKTPGFKTNRVPLFTVNGISKILGLPQMKLSWIHVDGPEKWKVECMERLEIIADTFLSVNTPIQFALPELLEWRRMIQGQLSRRIRRNLQSLNGLISDSKRFLFRSPTAGWYAILRSHLLRNPDAYCLGLLESENTLVHSGSMFGFPDEEFVLVISLIPENELFEEGLSRILRFSN